jgi:hypothetical protein
VTTEQSQEQGHEFSIDVEKRLVVVTLRGRVTLDSLLGTAEEIYTDGRAEPDFRTIVDIQTTDWALDFADMHTYSEQIGANPRMLKGKLVVVASTAVAYGIGRMYQGTHEAFPGEVKFEPTMEAAMKVMMSPDE